MKTVVKDRDEQGHPIWNERFSRFVSHHGFLLTSCRPYRARTKGKVENGIGYVRKNFWPRVRVFTGLDDLNRQAREWLNQVANVRIHGTTRVRPVDRWQEEMLRPINPTPFAVVDRHTRKVSADCLVSFEANRYSVPFRFMGQIVHVQDDKNGRIRISVETSSSRNIPRPSKKGRWSSTKSTSKDCAQPVNTELTPQCPNLLTNQPLKCMNETYLCMNNSSTRR